MEYSELFKEIFRDVYGHEMTDSERYLADKLEERLNKTFDTIGDLGEEVIYKPTE